MNLNHLFIAALAIAPLAAHAQSGFYVGGGIGGSRLEQAVNVTVDNYTDTAFPINGPNPVFVEVGELKGTDVAVRAFAGYRFGKWFSVEGGFFDMGDARESYAYVIPEISLGGVFFRGESDREINALNEINGYLFSAVGYFPITERIELIGKIGAVNWNSEQIVRDQVGQVIPVEQPTVPAVRVPGAPQRGNDVNDRPIRRIRDDGTDLALGFGVAFKVTDHLSLRGEFDWLDISNDKTVGQQFELDANNNLVLDANGNPQFSRTGPVGETDTAWIMTLSAIYRF